MRMIVTKVSVGQLSAFTQAVTGAWFLQHTHEAAAQLPAACSLALLERMQLCSQACYQGLQL